MRIEGQKIAATAVTGGTPDLIGRLETGDIIKAKVLQISSDEAYLRLSDGSVIKALLKERIEASAGQTIQLAVANKIDGTLLLETVKDFSRPYVNGSDMVKTMLEALKLPRDQANIALLTEFLGLNISPDSEQIKNARELMRNFREIDVPKAAFLASKGICPEAGTVKTLVKLLDGEIKLSEILKETESAIEILKIKLSGDAVGFNANSREIIGAVAEALNKALIEPYLKDAKITGGTAHAQNAFGQLPGHRSAGKEVTVNGKTIESANSGTVYSEVNGALPGNSEGSRVSRANHSVNTGNFSENLVNYVSNPPNQEKGEVNTSGIFASLQNDTADTVSDLMKTSGNEFATGNSEKTAGFTLSTHEASLNQIVYENIATDKTTDKEGLHDPFEKLSELNEEIFIKIRAVNPSVKQDIDTVENEINQKLDILRIFASIPEISKSEEGKKLIEAVSRFNEFVRAINFLIENNVVYFQLPVSLPVHKTSAEIYIMKNRHKKKKIDPQDTVMFISLDTKNIGRVESLIIVKGKNVSIRFRTEKEKVIDMGKENIKLLYEGLKSSGYRLVNINYELLGSPTPPAGIEKLITKFINESRNKVDLRV